MSSHVHSVERPLVPVHLRLRASLAKARRVALAWLVMTGLLFGLLVGPLSGMGAAHAQSSDEEALLKNPAALKKPTSSTSTSTNSASSNSASSNSGNKTSAESGKTRVSGNSASGGKTASGGSSGGEDRDANSGVNPEQESSTGLWVAIVIGVIAVLGAGIALVFVMRRRQGGSEATSGNVRPEALLKDLLSVTGQSEIQITENVVILGRLSSSSGPGVQGVTLPVNTVGRRHAEIEYRSHAYYISDLQSRNGTLVNGNKITKPSILHNGDVIHIEGVQLVFMLPVESQGDETQLVGSRGGDPAAVVTVAPGFEAKPDAAGGGGLIAMYGGDASNTGTADEPDTPDPSKAHTVLLSEPAVQAPAADAIDDHDEAPTAALEAATVADTPGGGGGLIASYGGADSPDDDAHADEGDDAPTAALDAAPAQPAADPESPEKPGGLIAAYSDPDDEDDGPATQAFDAPPVAPAASARPQGGSMIAQYGGDDDEPDPASTLTEEPAPAVDPAPRPAPEKPSLIAQYGGDDDEGPSAPTAMPETRPQVAPQMHAEPAPRDEKPSLIAQYGGAEDDAEGSEAPTSMMDGPGDDMDGGFDLLLDASDTQENLPVAAAYAETGAFDANAIQGGAGQPSAQRPIDASERTADVLRDAAQAVPGLLPTHDLEDTGASPRVDRAYLEAHGLVSPTNLPPAVPDAPRVPERPSTPLQPERAMPTQPSSGKQDVPMPPAFLIDKDGGTKIPQFRIETDNLYVGRSTPTQVQARSYFSIPSKTIGRKHASVRYARGRFWVEDHKSVNGTYVNGERVMGMAPLESGDEICFDTYRFSFLVMSESSDDPEEDADKTVFSGGR